MKTWVIKLRHLAKKVIAYSIEGEEKVVRPYVPFEAYAVSGEKTLYPPVSPGAGRSFCAAG